MLNNISNIKSPKSGLSWINIINAKNKEIDYLNKKYKFKELDLKDSYAAKYAQRPKFHQRNNYFFLILQFPYYDRPEKEIRAEEIDFFVTKNEIITVHNNNLQPIVDFFSECQTSNFISNQYLNSNVALLSEIIVRLQYYTYPILDHISLDIQEIESHIFAGQEREMVTKILYTKRNILNIRKIMEAHKNVLQKLIKENIKFFPVARQIEHYYNLIEHTKNMWGLIEGQKEVIESLENTNNALVSFKLSDIMKTLTIFSVVIIPLTLIASIFGMNVDASLPLINNPFGFWFILWLMLLSILIMLAVFKRKKWL